MAYTPTPEDRNTVRTMAAGGIPQERIAACIGGGITAKTMRKHFRRELAIAGDQANAVAVSMLFAAVQKGEAWAICFWLKCRAGWRETDRHEIVGEDGGPLRVVYEDKSVPE